MIKICQKESLILSKKKMIESEYCFSYVPIFFQKKKQIPNLAIFEK
jgi:hypothetical protein